MQHAATSRHHSEDYPEAQRNEILDLLFKPQCAAKDDLSAAMWKIRHLTERRGESKAISRSQRVYLRHLETITCVDFQPPFAWVCGGAGMVLLCKFWRLRLVAIHSSSLRVRRVKGHLERMVRSWLLLLLPLNEETRQHLYLGSSGHGLYPKNDSLKYV